MLPGELSSVLLSVVSQAVDNPFNRSVGLALTIGSPVTVIPKDHRSSREKRRQGQKVTRKRRTAGSSKKHKPGWYSSEVQPAIANEIEVGQDIAQGMFCVYF